MDIDSLFKAPKPSVSGGKRKLPDNPTPEMLKKMRFDTKVSHASGQGATPASIEPSAAKHRITVEDEEERDDHRNFAPGGDADYFMEEDEEGRFFGGGLTSEQKEILNIFDKAGEEGVQDDSDELTITSVRRILLRFERAASKNQEYRSKYPDDPTKFIDSEADLDVALKSLLPLAQNQPLAYPEIVRSGTITLLIGLLAHENVDIVIDVVEVIHELTDEDVGNDLEEDEAEESAEALKVLIKSLLENSILELLVDNLPRLNEEEESDRQGVFHILGIFENILGFDPKISEQLVEGTKFLPWLMNRIQSKQHDENRGYAAELLSILLQDDKKNRLELGKKDGVETILKVLSNFRRREPVDADETEFMENLFDTLCSALNEPAIKQLFLEAEGPDLMILMMREKNQSSSRAIKTLDYAMSGRTGASICEAFVDALGLKTLFSVLMGKVTKKQKPTAPASEDVTHILGVISSLLSSLPSDSPSRIRLLAKFVESNYEKVEKLLEIRDSALARLKVVEAKVNAEKKNLGDEDELASLEDSWYVRRLDGGLFTLQIVDYILAWIIMEDDGIRAHALQMLSRKNQTLQNIVETLQEAHSNLDVEIADDSTEHMPTRKEILEGLISSLDTSSTRENSS